MRRRALLKIAALSAGAAAVRSPLAMAFADEALVQPVKKVLLVTKCHLDVGFSMTQAKVMEKYFKVYYPQAIETAAHLRNAGEDRYTWTTGSWLLYEYLEQASAPERIAMEQSIGAGDIAWHGLPFNWQTEMLDRSMIGGCLGFSQELDRRFGRRTIGAKMTDVPGHTRGIVAPLYEAGIRLLDIGVNAASTPPDVPDVFLWKDSAGNSLAMMYHRHDYGSVLTVPGTDVAVAVEVRGDNSGPHTLEEIAAIYAKLRAQFPGAQVQASTLNEVAVAVEPVRDKLPVVTEEIGDTWIYGVASDPDKIADYRAIARLRKTWLRQNHFAVGDKTDRELLRRLALAAEHTWGTDTKSYLDNDHYRPRDLEQVLQTPPYQTMQVSWQEKRDDIAAGVASLPEALRKEAETTLSARRKDAPSSTGMIAADPAKPVETKHFTLRIDAATGAIIQLRNHVNGNEWASASHPLALFTYQTLSDEDYVAYRDRYILSKADWAAKDFGKPGIDAFHAKAGDWHPKLLEMWTSSAGDEDRVLLKMNIEDTAAETTGNVAWPREIYLELRMPHAEAHIELQLTTLGKQANRMPEAMWLTFAPQVGDARGWSFKKVDETIRPMDVVRGGGRPMHAVADGMRYEDKQGAFEINTLDAPLVALGVRSPLNFSLEQPNLAGGMHFSLFNNAWGTNYVQWAGGDWSYRFMLKV